MNLQEAQQKALSILEQDISGTKSKQALATILFNLFHEESKETVLGYIDEDWSLFGLTPEQTTAIAKWCEHNKTHKSEYDPYGDSMKDAYIHEVLDEETVIIKCVNGYENEDNSNFTVTYFRYDLT